MNTIVSLMINKSNNTDDKSGSTRTVVFFGVAIISLVAACTTFDGDEEVDLGGYSDIHEIQVADDEYLLIREREVQDWVGTCMRKAGFEYMAWLGNNYWTNEIPDSDTPTVDSIVANQNNTEQIEDPNAEIYDSLSRSEKTQYFEALWGKEDMEEGTFPNRNEERFGCYNVAWVELFGRDAVQARWEILDLSTELDELVRSTPVYLAAEQDWSSCMAASGYDLQTPTDIAHSIRLVSNSDSSLDFDNTRSFEREIRIANDECRGELEETITFLRNESLDSSIQGSIDILLADIAKRQNSN